MYTEFGYKAINTKIILVEYSNFEFLIINEKDLVDGRIKHKETLTFVFNFLC